MPDNLFTWGSVVELGDLSTTVCTNSCAMEVRRSVDDPNPGSGVDGLHLKFM